MTSKNSGVGKVTPTPLFFMNSLANLQSIPDDSLLNDSSTRIDYNELLFPQRSLGGSEKTLICLLGFNEIKGSC